MLDKTKLKIGQRVTINKNIQTVDGMLYKNSIVKIDAVGFPDSDLRVIDELGKIWYIDISGIGLDGKTING